MNEYHIAWWNVENLFEEENYADRARKVQANVGSALKGWTPQLRDKKIEQLASIIKQMGDGGPDLLGVCEIECLSVLEKLRDAINSVKHTYKIVHVDSPDPRAIDVAFFYDEKKFDVHPKASSDDDVERYKFSHEVRKRSATRDIFQVNFHTIEKKDKPLVIIGNHWPSRYKGGELETEPFRIIAGETLSYWVYRIQQEFDSHVPILVMGDFNDEPFNRSLVDMALSSRSMKKVSKATSNPMLLNLMWPLMGVDEASYFFGNAPLMIDQFLVSKGFLSGNSSISFDWSSVKIFTPDEIVMLTDPQHPNVSYKIPKRFGLPSKKSQFDETGYSDHYPICMKIEQK